MEKKKIDLCIIYNEIQNNPRTTQKGLAEKYGLTERHIRRYFKTLREYGYIEYIVNSKDRSWIVIKKYNP